jgi:ATP-dependent DNA helicase RecQ
MFYTFADLQRQYAMIEEENSNLREIKLAKLERLKQFAEGHLCRRRILLAYFNETSDQDCGNCDICAAPRQTFDGTVIAQKALSAIHRMQQRAPMNLVIDVLRGLRNQQVTSQGFDQIKTFGVGRELSQRDWQQYIYQLINRGLIDIAYDDHYALRLTESSNKVLYEQEKVPLVKVAFNFATPGEEKTKAKSKTEELTDLLFERLRRLRKKLADEQGIAPYMIFSDATLREMAAKRPVTSPELADLSGLSANKIAMYGADFLNEVLDFLAQEGQSLREATYFVSYHRLRQGMPPALVAQERNLNVDTIYSHIVRLLEMGFDLDPTAYIKPAEVKEIHEAIKVTPRDSDTTFKPIVEALGGRYSYGVVKLAQYLINRKK